MARDREKITEIKIGNYYLSRYKGIGRGIWIRRNDGEGGQFREKDISKVIEKFYKDNF